MSADFPAVPSITEAELNVRGLHAYVAQDEDDLVLVLQEHDPDGAGLTVTLESGFGPTLQEAIASAEELSRAAWQWAALLRRRAGQPQANRRHVDR
ncbi:hypothetical protein [Dactylosporangium sp. CA-139066]|uniref:hypothetical protein n=1 Tax=Dactylosporangium sp. CA-139066 TaxID=3239930 RepID=UPI003D941ADB